MATTKIDDVGFLTITLGDTSVRIDLYDANNKIAALSKEHGQNPAAYLAGVVDLMKSLGYPGCSHWAANQWVKAICEAVEGLAANFPPTPGSPGSTESIPGP